MTFDDFVAYYNEKNTFPGGQYCNPDKAYNEQQLQTKYEKFLSAIEKRKRRQDESAQKQYEKAVEKSEQVDQKWVCMRERVYLRDNQFCRLFKVLNQSEKEQFGANFGWKWKYILTPAHVFKVGSNPSIKYNEDYVVTLNLASHGMLDSGKCPITGKAISEQDVENWWKRIVGEQQYNKLKEALNE